MRNLRRHLGPGYTDYPAKRIGEYLGDKLFKLVMWIICCLLWSGVYYVMLSVVNFNRANFLENAKEMTSGELFMSPGGLLGFGAGCFILLFVVLRARRGEKRMIRRGVGREDADLRRPQQ